MTIDAQNLLSAIPQALREELISCYQQIVRNYAEGRWEPAELNGGKFCEIVYSVLQGAIQGCFPLAASKPKNMVDACRLLESSPPDTTRVGDRSLRILIPRLLPFLYEIRNNRGVGHVGGDVDPNHADAEAVLSASTWVMAELVRIFHRVSVPVAQRAVETLVDRKHPLVWHSGLGKRVLDPEMTKANQALVLLYSESDWIEAGELSAWVEYSSPSMFKKRVLEPLHSQRLIEFVPKTGRVRISPRGIKSVEDILVKRK